MVDPRHALNLIAFHTGWGDGAYPAFWGYDTEGNVTALVADFELLSDEDWVAAGWKRRSRKIT